jgi:hypothetical protein
MRGSGRGDEDEGIHEQPAVQVFRVLALAVRPLLVLDRQPLGAFQVSLKRDTKVQASPFSSCLCRHNTSRLRSHGRTSQTTIMRRVRPEAL